MGYREGGSHAVFKKNDLFENFVFSILDSMGYGVGGVTDIFINYPMLSWGIGGRVGVGGIYKLSNAILGYMGVGGDE